MIDDRTIARFFDQVSVGAFGECALWCGTLARGYGYFYWPQSGTKSGQVLAHRFAYELFNKPAPVVMHTCDTPRCVNPYHLAGGDTAANIRDMINKGRHRGGPLTDEQADELRRLPKHSPLPDWPGLTRDQIRNAAYWIRRGKTYASRRVR